MCTEAAQRPRSSELGCRLNCHNDANRSRLIASPPQFTAQSQLNLFAASWLDAVSFQARLRPSPFQPCHKSQPTGCPCHLAGGDTPFSRFPTDFPHRTDSCPVPRPLRVRHMSALCPQVTNQLKILPTAGFSALFLGRQLTYRQWVALPLLALGVAAVNASSASGARSGLSAFSDREREEVLEENAFGRALLRGLPLHWWWASYNRSPSQDMA